MNKFLFTVRSTLIRIEEFFVSVLMIAMTTVISYGIFERYVIQHGAGWTDELSRYISIAAIFFGASLGIVKGAHVGVEVFVKLLPQSLQAVCARLASLICTAFMGVMAYYGFIYFLRLFKTGQVTPALQFPLCYAFLAVPVGCSLMCAHFLIQLLLTEETEGQNG